MKLVDLNISVPSGKSSIEITLSNTFLSNCLAVKPHRHSHSKYELHFVSGCDCVFTVENRLVTVRDGQILLIQPKAEHSLVHRPENQKGHIGVFSFALSGEPDSIARIFAVAAWPCTAIEDDFSGKIRLQGIQDEVQRQAPFFYEKICGEFFSLLTDLARALSLEVPPAPLPLRGLDQNRTEIIEEYFLTRYSSPSCSSRELAQRLFLTQRQLYRILVESYGKSFREMLLQTRMEYADFALNYTAGTLNSLAEQVGYSSSSAFSLAYRRYYGRAPRFACPCKNVK